MRWQKNEQTVAIPMRIVGPVKIISAEANGDIPLPLATFESPLWPSTHRGARVCTLSGGINAVLMDERMSRSVLVEADSVATLHEAAHAIKNQITTLQTLVSTASRFAKLLTINHESLAHYFICVLNSPRAMLQVTTW